MKLKHNKKRNTAFLYETLVKELTKAVVHNKIKQKNVLVSIIKESFAKNTLLRKELDLFKILSETKHVDEKVWKEAKKIQEGDVEKKCPKCKEGNIVLRSSVYGKFYGCSKYPKCKYTEKLVDDSLKENSEKKE